METEAVVIFGAGFGGVKIKRMLVSMGYSVVAFCDNSEKKWGTVVDGLPIIAPHSLAEKEYKVLIASSWEKEIIKQLQEMGLSDRIVTRDDFTYDYLKKSSEKYANLCNAIPANKKITFVFALDYAMADGGVESWSYVIADELIQKGERVHFITDINPEIIPSRYANMVSTFDIAGDNYVKVLDEMIDHLVSVSPCVVIDSWQTMTMLASAIIKTYGAKDHSNNKLIPCLIGIIHNDLPRLFQTVSKFSESYDYAYAVCKELSERLITAYGFPKEKVCYRPSPIIMNQEYHVEQRSYSLDSNSPLRIGYGARLVKSQKRADQLMPVIEGLCNANIKFRLQIAGTGELEKTLRDYVRDNGLEKDVEIKGLVPRDEMKQFWENQDVFINLSEYEGVGLSMLESMAAGCVPVVTAVAGSTEFVTDGLGFICNINAPDEFVERLVYLDTHRYELPIIGRKAAESIRAKCSPKDYAEHLISLCLRSQDEKH